MTKNQSNSDEIVKSEEGQVLTRAEHFSGPLPHPETLQKYEDVVPGAAQIIISKFEQQTDHRISIEKSVVKTGNLKEVLGLFAGFLIAMTAIIGGIVTAVNGTPLFAAGLSAAGIGMIVYAFVLGKKANSNSSE